MTPAERLLVSFGVARPADIDLEAIAWGLGAEVRYRRLDGCEARVIGYGDRAIISIDQSRPPTRRRFSLGHELGHWHHHRGASSICRSSDIGGVQVSKAAAERLADQFAADLLMPAFMFRPLIATLDFVTIDRLAAAFGTSRMATAIRLVELALQPVLLVCHGQKGRLWFRRSEATPPTWFPRAELDSRSGAMDVLYGAVKEMPPRLAQGSSWFDNPANSNTPLIESSVREHGGNVLTLLVPARRI